MSEGDKEYRQAALRAMPQSLLWGPTSTSFELDLATPLDLEAQRQRILDCRSKVQYVQDERLRAAYVYWLDFFERENDEAREEMLSHTVIMASPFCSLVTLATLSNLSTRLYD